MKTKTNTAKILIPKCPYCKSESFYYEVEYIENKFCEVTANCCDCDKEYALTFECTMITKLED